MIRPVCSDKGIPFGTNNVRKTYMPYETKRKRKSREECTIVRK